MGFAFYPFFCGERHGVSWERLLDMADKCLYVAKRSGRNAWVGLSPRDEGDQDHIRDRIPQDLVALVRNGALVVQTSIADPTTLKWSQEN